MLEKVIQHDIDKIDWKWLSGNPNGLHLLEQNIDNPRVVIDAHQLSGNPYIYTIDSKQLNVDIIKKANTIDNVS